MANKVSAVDVTGRQFFLDKREKKRTHIFSSEVIDRFVDKKKEPIEIVGIRVNCFGAVTPELHFDNCCIDTRIIRHKKLLSDR
nr:hypothetical protein [Petrocella atlantisensis]